MGATPTDRTQPKNVRVASTGDGTVTLAWDAVEGAKRYAVAEKLPNGTFRTFTYDAGNDGYTVSNISNGKQHRFLVQAYVDGAWSDFTDANLVSAAPQGVTKPVVTAKAGERCATLGWQRVPGAERYAVASRNADGSYKTYSYDVPGATTTYKVSGLRGGVSYQFLVQAYVDGAWTSFSSSDLVSVTPTDRTQSKNVRVTSTGDGTVTLAWDAVQGAERYAVAEYYHGEYRTFTYDCTATKFTAHGVANERSHQFLVQACVNGSWSSFDSSFFVNAMPHGTYKPTVTAKGGVNNITLQWNSVPGATSYAVAQRLSDGSYYPIAYGVRGQSYTIWNLPGGATLGYVVQAYFDCDRSYSSFTKSDIAYAKVLAPTLQQRMILKAQSYSSNTGWLLLVDRSACRVGIFNGSYGNWGMNYYWQCTPGKPSTPTVSGVFKVLDKKPHLNSTAAAKYCTRFYGNYYFHSILKSYDELGHQLSHGCVRMGWGDANWIYQNIPIGTKVVVY